MDWITILFSVIAGLILIFVIHNFVLKLVNTDRFQYLTAEGDTMGVTTVIKDYGTDILNAIRENNLQRLKVILEKQLKTDRKIEKLCTADIKHKPTKKFACPLILAARNEDPRILKYMLDKGVDPNFIHHTIFSSKRREVVTPLHIAVDLSFYDNVEVLLGANADCNIQDHNDETPLHIAVKKADRVLAQMLLSKGADPTMPDRRGNAALHIATNYGHLQLVRSLLKYDADVYQKGQWGAIAPHIAAREGHIHLIQLFCSRDMGNINIKIPCYADQREKALMHLAAENGHVETALALLDQFDAEVNLKDSDGNTPLHCLVLNQYNPHRMRDKEYFTETARVLIKYRVSINEKNMFGDTALHLAAMNQFQRIVELLLKLGANPFVENEEGLKPLDVTPDTDPVTQQLLKYAMLHPRQSMASLSSQDTDQISLQNGKINSTMNSSSVSEENPHDTSFISSSMSSVFMENQRKNAQLHGQVQHGQGPQGKEGPVYSKVKKGQNQNNREEPPNLSQVVNNVGPPPTTPLSPNMPEEQAPLPPSQPPPPMSPAKVKQNQLAQQAAAIAAGNRKHEMRDVDHGTHGQQTLPQDTYQNIQGRPQNTQGRPNQGFKPEQTPAARPSEPGSRYKDTSAVIHQHREPVSKTQHNQAIQAQNSQATQAQINQVPHTQHSKGVQAHHGQTRQAQQSQGVQAGSAGPRSKSQSTGVQASTMVGSIQTQTSLEEPKQQPVYSNITPELQAQWQQQAEARAAADNAAPQGIHVQTFPDKPGTIEVRYDGGPITISVDTQAGQYPETETVSQYSGQASEQYTDQYSEVFSDPGIEMTPQNGMTEAPSIGRLSAMSTSFESTEFEQYANLPVVTNAIRDTVRRMTDPVPAPRPRRSVGSEKHGTEMSLPPDTQHSTPVDSNIHHEDLDEFSPDESPNASPKFKSFQQISQMWKMKDEGVTPSSGQWRVQEGAATTVTQDLEDEDDRVTDNTLEELPPSPVIEKATHHPQESHDEFYSITDKRDIHGQPQRVENQTSHVKRERPTPSPRPDKVIPGPRAAHERKPMPTFDETKQDEVIYANLPLKKDRQAEERSYIIDYGEEPFTQRGPRHEQLEQGTSEYPASEAIQPSTLRTQNEQLKDKEPQTAQENTLRDIPRSSKDDVPEKVTEKANIDLEVGSLSTESLNSLNRSFEGQPGGPIIHMQVTGDTPKAYTKRTQRSARKAFMKAPTAIIESSSDVSDTEFGSRTSVMSDSYQPKFSGDLDQYIKPLEEANVVHDKKNKKDTPKKKLIGMPKPYKSFGKIEVNTTALVPGVGLVSDGDTDGEHSRHQGVMMSSFSPSASTNVKVTQESPKLKRAEFKPPDEDVQGDENLPTIQASPVKVSKKFEYDPMQVDPQIDDSASQISDVTEASQFDENEILNFAEEPGFGRRKPIPDRPALPGSQEHYMPRQPGQPPQSQPLKHPAVQQLQEDATNISMSTVSDVFDEDAELAGFDEDVASQNGDPTSMVNQKGLIISGGGIGKHQQVNQRVAEPPGNRKVPSNLGGLEDSFEPPRATGSPLNVQSRDRAPAPAIKRQHEKAPMASLENSFESTRTNESPVGQLDRSVPETTGMAQGKISHPVKPGSIYQPHHISGNKPDQTGPKKPLDGQKPVPPSKPGVKPGQKPAPLGPKPALAQKPNVPPKPAGTGTPPNQRRPMQPKQNQDTDVMGDVAAVAALTIPAAAEKQGITEQNAQTPTRTPRKPSVETNIDDVMDPYEPSTDVPARNVKDSPPLGMGEPGKSAFTPPLKRKGMGSGSARSTPQQSDDSAAEDAEVAGISEAARLKGQRKLLKKRGAAHPIPQKPSPQGHVYVNFPADSQSQKKQPANADVSPGIPQATEKSAEQVKQPQTNRHGVNKEPNNQQNIQPTEHDIKEAKERSMIQEPQVRQQIPSSQLGMHPGVNQEPKNQMGMHPGRQQRPNEQIGMHPNMQNGTNNQMGMHPGIQYGQNNQPGMQQRTNDQIGMHPGMQQGPNNQIGMHPGMQQGPNNQTGMHPGMQQGPNSQRGIHPGMQQGQNNQPGMHPGLQQGPNSQTSMHQGMQQGPNSQIGMHPGMQPGQNSQIGMHPGMQQGQNHQPGMPRGMQQGPNNQPGMHPGIQQGPNNQPGMHPAMQQIPNNQPGMHPGMQQGPNNQPGMQQGQNNQTGMHPGMQQAQNNQSGIPQRQNSQTGMHPGMQQGQSNKIGMHPGMQQPNRQGNRNRPHGATDDGGVDFQKLGEHDMRPLAGSHSSLQQTPVRHQHKPVTETNIDDDLEPIPSSKEMKPGNRGIPVGHQQRSRPPAMETSIDDPVDASSPESQTHNLANFSIASDVWREAMEGQPLASSENVHDMQKTDDKPRHLEQGLPSPIEPASPGSHDRSNPELQHSSEDAGIAGTVMGKPEVKLQRQDTVKKKGGFFSIGSRRKKKNKKETSDTGEGQPSDATVPGVAAAAELSQKNDEPAPDISPMETESRGAVGLQQDLDIYRQAWAKDNKGQPQQQTESEAQQPSAHASFDVSQGQVQGQQPPHQYRGQVRGQAPGHYPNQYGAPGYTQGPISRPAGMPHQGLPHQQGPGRMPMYNQNPQIRPGQVRHPGMPRPGEDSPQRPSGQYPHQGPVQMQQQQAKQYPGQTVIQSPGVMPTRQEQQPKSNRQEQQPRQTPERQFSRPHSSSVSSVEEGPTNNQGMSKAAQRRQAQRARKQQKQQPAETMDVVQNMWQEKKNEEMPIIQSQPETNNQQQQQIFFPEGMHPGMQQQFYANQQQPRFPGQMQPGMQQGQRPMYPGAQTGYPQRMPPHMTQQGQYYQGHPQQIQPRYPGGPEQQPGSHQGGQDPRMRTDSVSSFEDAAFASIVSGLHQDKPSQGSYPVTRAPYNQQMGQGVQQENQGSQIPPGQRVPRHRQRHGQQHPSNATSDAVAISSMWKDKKDQEAEMQALLQAVSDPAIMEQQQIQQYPEQPYVQGQPQGMNQQEYPQTNVQSQPQGMADQQQYSEHPEPQAREQPRRRHRRRKETPQSHPQEADHLQAAEAPAFQQHQQEDQQAHVPQEDGQLPEDGQMEAEENADKTQKPRRRRRAKKIVAYPQPGVRVKIYRPRSEQPEEESADVPEDTQERGMSGIDRSDIQLLQKMWAAQASGIPLGEAGSQEKGRRRRRRRREPAHDMAMSDTEVIAQQQLSDGQFPGVQSEVEHDPQKGTQRSLQDAAMEAATTNLPSRRPPKSRRTDGMTEPGSYASRYRGRQGMTSDSRYGDSELADQGWSQRNRSMTTESEAEADVEDTAMDDSLSVDPRRSIASLPNPRSHPQHGYPGYPPSRESSFYGGPPHPRMRRRRGPFYAGPDLPPRITEPGPVDFNKYGFTAQLWMERVDKRTVDKSRSMSLTVDPSENLPESLRSMPHFDSSDDVFLPPQWVIARGRRGGPMYDSNENIRAYTSESESEMPSRPMTPGRQMVIFFKVGGNWRYLAWILFEGILNEAELMRLIKDVQLKHPGDLTAQVHDMMKRWWKKKGSSATIEQLRRALELVDMAYIQEEHFDHRSSITSFTESEDELDIQDIAENDPNVTRLENEYQMRSLNNSFELDPSGGSRPTSFHLSSDSLARRLGGISQSSSFLPVADTASMFRSQSESRIYSTSDVEDNRSLNTSFHVQAHAAKLPKETNL